MTKKKKEYVNPQKKAAFRECQYDVYTDGGCAVNPGGPGGIGVVIIDRETGEVTEFSKEYFSTTNNRMEIRAIIEGIRKLPEGAKVKLISDSQYALNCIDGTWSKKTNLDLWTEYEKVAKGKQIYTHWVRGHNGNEFNERCDELASEAMFQNDLETDDGYDGNRKAAADKTNTKGSMGVKVCVNTDVCGEKLAGGVPNAEVNRQCFTSITDFYKNNIRNFKAYAAIKTGGIDRFSRMTAEMISEYSPSPEEYLSTIRQYFKDERLVSTCARWNIRGLSLDDAIRKVLVDQEISLNCIRR